MPMVSQKQRKWMWANDKEMAREFESHTKKGKELPIHKKKKRHPQLGKRWA